MTPGWEKKALGAPVTFVGMYEAMDVIVLAADLDEIEVSLHLCAPNCIPLDCPESLTRCPQDPEEQEKFKKMKNPHNLPEPIENNEARTEILRCACHAFAEDEYDGH
jgi:hypothetical protein